MNFKLIYCFFPLLTLLTLLSCSLNLVNHQNDSSLPTPTPDFCQLYAGEWYAQFFWENEDESKIICDGKPCEKITAVTYSYNIICEDGKMTGTRTMRTSTHSDANPKIFKTPTPEIREETTPLEVVKIDKDQLFISYSMIVYLRTRLFEVKVSPKGDFLLGKIMIRNHQELNDTQNSNSKKLSRIDPYDEREGKILLIRK